MEKGLKVKIVCVESIDSTHLFYASKYAMERLMKILLFML
ncbi:hypothetical protein CSQ_1575 [Campylobacter jejuni subsp. jejuni DFVF1099]|nr:hypothetical protein CSQ_1575 [Campylobacter jejuni subsp. jejuni DFVF1099]